MPFCKNCGHRISAHLYLTNAESSERIGMICIGTNNKNNQDGNDDYEYYKMEKHRDKDGRLVLKSSCKCPEVDKLSNVDHFQTTLDRWIYLDKRY